MSWLVVALGAWALGWWVNGRLAQSPLARTRGGKLAVPVIFGLTILILWEGLVRGLGVSPVILPPPSAVAAKFAVILIAIFIHANIPESPNQQPITHEPLKFWRPLRRAQ